MANKLDNLIRKYLSGDADSFDQIYEETKKGVYLSIYQIIPNRSVIEDLMQDTYLKVIDSINSYQMGTNFNAWVCKIARNNALNYYNKNSKIEYVDAYENESIFGSNNQTPLLDHALSILEGKEKEIFTYHIVLGYKFKDIAKILEINMKTAFYLYKKAINKIKEQI